LKNLLNVALLASSSFILFSCSPVKDNAALLVQAQHEIQSGNTPEAAINLKNIIKADPEHAYARYLLGKIYLNADNYQSAQKELVKSLALDPTNQQAILLLAKTYLSLSQYSLITELLEGVEFTNINDQVYALLLSGQAYLNIGNKALAIEKITEANDLSSDSQYSMLGKALIAAYDNSSDEALSLLDNIIAQDSSFVDAWLLKGSIHSNLHQYKEAAEAYLAYNKQKPQNFGIKTLIAHNYIKAGEFELAKPQIEQLLKINENHPTINVLAAQIKYVDKDYQGAKELADRVINATNNGLAQMIAGLSDFYLGNFEQSYYQLNAIAGRLPQEHQINKILALLQVKLGYNNELTENLAQASKFGSNDADLYANLAMEFENQGNKDSALTMFSKANKLAPDNAKIKAQLGILKLRNNDQTGVQELERAIGIDPEFQPANIALAMNYLKNNEIQKAIDLADNWLLQSPNNISALILRGNIAIKSDTPDDAVVFFKKALEASPENVTALFNLAVLFSNKGNFSQSNHYLDELFRADLEYPYAYRLAISNALSLDKEEELEQKIFSFIKNSPSAVWPRIIMARRLTIKQQYKSAFDILNELTNYAELPYAFFQTMVLTLTKENDTKKIAVIFEKWFQQQPNNKIAYLDYINILDQQKNYNQALLITNLALQQKSLENSLQLRALEAYYLLATMQIERAHKKITLLANQNPEHAFILRLQGQLALAKQNYTDAVKYLSKSLKSNQNIDTKRYLVNALILSSQPDSAVALINEQLTKTPNNEAFLKLLAEINIEKDPDSALKYYKNLIKSRTNDYGALNNLAWIYMQKGDLDKALQYSSKAKGIAPKHPQILDTYGKILTKQNKLDDAISTLSAAYKLHPKNTQIMLSLKEAYLANNNIEQAKRITEQIEQQQL